MTLGVDAELWWGDAQLALGRHPRDAPIACGAPGFPAAFVPFDLAEADVWLTVPPAATAWVRTVNGWRDLSTLRVLGHIQPHPSWPGAARVRLRRLADVDGWVEGAAITTAIEAWLGAGPFWLRVALNDGGEVQQAPRFDGAELRRRLAFAGAIALALAGILASVAALPPRTRALSIERLDPPTPRLFPVRVAPLDRAAPTVETKHEVDAPRPPGGRTPNDDAPVRAARPRRAGPRDRSEPRGFPERLLRMRRAVGAIAQLDAGASPFTARASRDGADATRLASLEGGLGGDVQRLATLRGNAGAGLTSFRSAAWRGPLEAGAGGGVGRAYVPPPRPITTRAVALHRYRIVPICERRWWTTADGRRTWSCHGSHAGEPAREHIRRVVRRHLAELRFCFEHGVAAGSLREGRITLAWEIDEAGTVTDVEVAHHDIADTAVVACMRAAPRRWHFGSVGPVRVSYPFVFRAL